MNTKNNQTPTTGSESLKKIHNANSPLQMKNHLATTGAAPMPLLEDLLRNTKSNKGLRIMFLIFALLAVGAMQYAGFLGAKFILGSAGAGIITAICGIIEVSVLLLLFSKNSSMSAMQSVKYLFFELLPLLVMGYFVIGIFGKENIKNAADQKMTEMYSTVESHRLVADQTAASMQNAVDNAIAVQAIEKKRDGEGPVWQKAALMSQIKPATVKKFTKVEVPEFENLIDANKWLSERTNAYITQVTDYDNAVNSMKDQAATTYAGLQEALKSKLSELQTGDMQSLSHSLEGIAGAKPSDAPMQKLSLTRNDLEPDGFQKYYGWLGSLGILFLMFLIAAVKDTKMDSDKFRHAKEEQLRSHIGTVLENLGMIGYDSDELARNGVGFPEQFKLLTTIETNPEFAQWLRNQNMSFDECAIFMKQNPAVGSALVNATWPLREVKKQMNADADFGNYAADAMKMTFTDWNMVKAMNIEVHSLFRMNDTDRDAFLKMCNQVKLKTKRSFADIGKFMEQFTYEEGITPDFMEKLQVCVAALDGSTINSINANFLRTATPDVLKLICGLVTNANRFSNIAKGWTERDNDAMHKIMSNGIKQSSEFDRFTGIVINDGGLTAIRTMMQAYQEKTNEAANVKVGTKQLVLNPDFAVLESSAKGLKDTEFMEAVKEAFQFSAS